MSFGINLKNKRTAKKYTQEQFAEKMGVSRQAVSLWESDNGYPEVEKLLEIVRILDVSLDYLFYGPNQNEIKSKTSDSKITVFSPFENIIVKCEKIAPTQQFKGKDNEPKYALYATYSFIPNGENRTILGWYKDEKSLSEEMAEIYKAVMEHRESYTIKYAVKVKKKGLRMEMV